MTTINPNRGSFTATSRTVGTVNLSTNVDGITGADIIDMGGLALSAIKLSTGVNACIYAFRGSMETTASMLPIYNSVNGRVAAGTSSVAMGGRIMAFDPPQFSGYRYLQIETITSTGGGVAMGSGATADICLADRSKT